MYISKKAKEEEIKGLFEVLEVNELYVVDVKIKEEGTSETINQWYIYYKKKDAKNYLKLCRQYFKAHKNAKVLRYVRNWKKLYQTIEYVDAGNSIIISDYLTKVKRAA